MEVQLYWNRLLEAGSYLRPFCCWCLTSVYQSVYCYALRYPSQSRPVPLCLSPLHFLSLCFFPWCSFQLGLLGWCSVSLWLSLMAFCSHFGLPLNSLFLSHFAYKALLHYTNMDTAVEHRVIWNKIKSWSLAFFCKEFLKAANVLSNTHLHQTFWPHSWKYLSPRLHFPKSLATFQSNVCLSRAYFLIVQ